MVKYKKLLELIIKYANEKGWDSRSLSAKTGIDAATIENAFTGAGKFASEELAALIRVLEIDCEDVRFFYDGDGCPYCDPDAMDEDKDNAWMVHYFPVDLGAMGMHTLELFVTDEGNLSVQFDRGHYWESEVTNIASANVKIKYCPFCGRLLNEPEV